MGHYRDNQRAGGVYHEIFYEAEVFNRLNSEAQFRSFLKVIKQIFMGTSLYIFRTFLEHIFHADFKFSNSFEI